jgi:hypothetical protein
LGGVKGGSHEYILHIFSAVSCQFLRSKFTVNSSKELQNSCVSKASWQPSDKLLRGYYQRFESYIHILEGCQHPPDHVPEGIECPMEQLTESMR